ncbi:HD domain-containing protein [Lapidilactobacillus wuchangensis]|uniref:HD domain-containing protein n=1 Tax=Lapidilactobacillus wuchangensis TaxID=2486001 RepID=UPI000F76D753|nr:HD domain-containing protein [Lapidilactobacillus wuchangensis]
MVDLTIIATFAQQQTASDHTGHDWAHLQRVAVLTQQLLTSYPQVDQQVALAAAYTHDVLDEKLVDATTAVTLRAQLTKIYQQAGLTATQITAIYEIIDHLSYSKNLKTHWQLSLAGQLVQDADRLDALGAVGIGRTFYYGASKGAPMYDPQVPPRTNLDHQSYREVAPVLNHFDEKLFKLAALMNTPQAKVEAERRTDFMKQFVAEFKAEWQVDNHVKNN